MSSVDPEKSKPEASAADPAFDDGLGTPSLGGSVPDSEDGDFSAEDGDPVEHDLVAGEADADAGEADADAGEDAAAERDGAVEVDAAVEAEEDAEVAEAEEADQHDEVEAEDAEAEEVEAASTMPEVEEDEDAPKMEWYILKVQSNRENSICDGLRRRIAVEGLEEYFGDVLVPTEDVAEYKNGKRRVVKRKLYPGYIVVHMVINDETWFAVRETPGIGDFTGSAGKPTPMLPHEVERIVKSARPDEHSEEPIKTAIPFKVGDRVRIKEGTFENFEGDVEGIDEANGRVTVMINIFGRSTPVELEHWQIEAV